MSVRRRLQVSSALASYSGMSPNELFPRLELRRDLGLQPLDIVLFVMDFEESDDMAFPFEELEQATTVGELVGLMTGWLHDYDRAERLAAEEEHFGDALGSGTYSAVPRASAQ